MAMEKPKSVVGEFWGGLAAMLVAMQVAMPSAIAFAVAVFPRGRVLATQRSAM